MSFTEFFPLGKAITILQRKACFSVSAPFCVSFSRPTPFVPTESISEKGWGKVPQIVSSVPALSAFEPECTIDGSCYRNANQVP